jgi:hypothetical protein
VTDLVNASDDTFTGSFSSPEPALIPLGFISYAEILIDRLRMGLRPEHDHCAEE